MRSKALWGVAAGTLAMLLTNGAGTSAQQRRQPEVSSADKTPLVARQIERISIDDLKKKLEGGEVIVIDVRTRDQYRAGHIPGAESVPLRELSARIPDLKKATAPIVTYCA